MKNIFRKSRLVLSLLLLLGVIFACAFASNVKVSANDINYEKTQYKLSYEDDNITLLLSTDFSSYFDFTREDLSELKEALKEVIIQAFSEDVDFSKYGSDKKERARIVKLNIAPPTSFGDNVDVSVLTNIIVSQLGSVEIINENFLGGITYDLMIKYYIDNYANGFVESKASTPQATTKNDVLDEIQTQLIDAIVSKVESEYTKALVEQSIAESAKELVEQKIKNLVASVKEETVEITLSDVVDIINTVEVSQDVIEFVQSSGITGNVNEIIMSADKDEITSLFTDTNIDTLIKVVKETEIVDSTNVLDILNNIGIENIIEIADKVSLDKLAELADAVNLSREDLAQVVEDNINTIAVSDLLKLFKGLYINDSLIFSKDGGISVDGVKAFLKTLPRPSEVQDWTDEEMKLSWNVTVTTALGDIETSLTVGFFGDCEKVRRIAKIIADHVALYNDDGTYTLELLAPDKTADLITKFLNNNYLSDELKQRIFEDLSLSVEELYNKFNSTTIEEYVDLLKQVDYKSVIAKVLDGKTLSNNLGITITDSQIDNAIDFVIKFARKLEDKTYADILAFLDDYIDVSALENEKLESLFNYFIKALNKIDDGTLSSEKIREWLNSETSTNESVYSRIDNLANYEEKFETLKSFVTKVYNKLPERYTKKTIVEYYVSENTFDASANINVKKAIEVLPAKVEDAINVLFDRIPESMSLRVKLTIPHVYKITYTYGNNSKVGFLPSGVKIAEYPGIEEVNGIELQGWLDENGDDIEIMPERDIVVTAKAEYIVSVSDDIERDYDPEEESRISVTVSPEAEYSYQWYKDDEIIADATNSYYDVINVSDSGEYYCVVTVEGGDTVTSDIITVSISKAKIDVSEIHWDENVKLPYNGKAQSITLLGDIDEKISILKKDYTKTAAGKYTAKVELSVKSDYADNYEIYGTVEDTEWEITVVQIDVSGYAWPTTKSYVYTGSEIEHKLVSEINPLIKAVYKTNAEGMYYTAYTNVGKFKASVTFAAVNQMGIDSIKIVGSVADDEWEITPKLIDVSSYAWTDQNSFVYDGTQKKVTIKTTPYEKFSITYENNAATKAGKYKAVATITSSDNNIKASQETFELEWEIAKATYDMSGAMWNYTKAYTYNGSEQKIEVVGLPNGVTVKTYTDNAKTNAGSYTAKVEFAYDSENYNAPSLANKQWEILKADYDMSEAKWNYTDEIVYNGQAQKIEVIGLPNGVTVKAYTDNEKTDAGFYLAKVTFNYDTVNYNEPKLSDEAWSIEKATLDISGAEWNYTESYTYNGSEQKVEVTGLPNGVTVKSYIDNAKINAGTYTAKAELDYNTNNYIFNDTLTLTWEIKPITIDVSGYKWQTELEFTYDGTGHSVVISSQVHEMIDIVYANNNKRDVGTYTAKANCVLKQEALNNYVIVGEIPTCEWVIKKADTPTPEKVYEYEPYKIDDVDVIIVKAPAGLSSEYQLKISECTEKVNVRNAIDGKVIIAFDVYDLHFEKDDVEKKVEGNFKVSMLIPENLRNKNNVGVIHIDNNNKVTFVEFTRNGDYVEFDAQSFSLFAVVEVREAINILIIIAIGVIAILMIIAIITYFAKKKEDEDGNIDPFFIKLASCNPEVKSYYYQLRSTIKDYRDKLKCTINAYIETFEVEDELIASIEVKNAKLIVRANNKKIVVYDTITLNKGKKLLSKTLGEVDFSNVNEK